MYIVFTWECNKLSVGQRMQKKTMENINGENEFAFDWETADNVNCFDWLTVNIVA